MEEKERDQGTEDETSYLDALIGEEEQNVKKNKETGNRFLTGLPRTIRSPLMTCRVHMVGLF